MHQSISNDEFYQQQKNDFLNILDVREEHEYSAGHIPGAENLQLSRLVDKTDNLDQSKHYHVICQSGGRSAQASAYLAQLGYQVTNVMGGMSTWKGEVTKE